MNTMTIRVTAIGDNHVEVSNGSVTVQYTAPIGGGKVVSNGSEVCDSSGHPLWWEPVFPLIDMVIFECRQQRVHSA